METRSVPTAVQLGTTPLYVLPRLVHLAFGTGEGRSPLNAFDNALLAAGVHNLNLVRVSSIVPVGSRFGDLPDLPVGTVMPTVYSQVSSAVEGELISACVGAGVGAPGGVLMEYSHRGSAVEAERVVLDMVNEGFERRGWVLDDVLFATAECRVERLACAVACAVLCEPEPVEALGATR